MRQDCVYEILNWILYFPDRYLQNNCIVYVTKAITDPVCENMIHIHLDRLLF